MKCKIQCTKTYEIISFFSAFQLFNKEYSEFVKIEKIKILFINLITVFIILMLFCAGVYAQVSNDNFGYKDWPGKDNELKCNIELQITPFTGYELKGTFSPHILYFNLPISKEDKKRQGRLVLQIFPTIEKAQMALLENLYTFESNSIRPPRLNEKDFPFGDVCFGWLNGDTITGEIFKGRHVWYVKNNVFIIIEAIPSFVDELAAKVDSIIQSAAVCLPESSDPKFVFSDEFVDFFLKTP